MYSNYKEKEKFITINCYNNSLKEALDNLEELKELVNTAGGCVISSLYQKLNFPDSKTYLGPGKIDELKELIKITNATAIVADDELTPVQLANLEKILDIKVIDRTILILDIFAKNARTKESKLQIELAQLSNYYSHIKGASGLSRLGGGIGTKGPGEKKLELDRRYIRNNINNIRHELKEYKVHNNLINESRKKKGAFRFAIIGYTNAGKSTLLNKLTNENVLSEDKLFATLDVITRELYLPSKQKVLLSDTVGFINKLPHKLIESFTTTLEDAKNADALIHIIDSSSQNFQTKINLVYDILKELNIKNKPIISVFNKIDKIDSLQHSLKDINAQITINMSIINNIGITDLLEAMSEVKRSNLIYLEFKIKYSNLFLIDEIRSTCELIHEEYLDDGVFIKAYINEKIFNKIHSIKE